MMNQYLMISINVRSDLSDRITQHEDFSLISRAEQESFETKLQHDPDPLKEA